ncbi:MAG: hypothetical protein Q9162_000502 [Coniocarpon cinnabarinum]
MADDFDQKSQAFKLWFLSHSGASLSSGIDLKDLRSEGRGRGVDTELFTIDPQSVLSTSTSELLSRLPQQIQDKLSTQSWPALILVLIYEHLQGEKSKWRPYVRLLPTEQDFDTLMYWTDEELNELQASAIREKIGRDDAEAMFKEHVLPVVRAHSSVFFPSEETPLDDKGLIQLAHRMASIIMSYAFDVEKTSKADEADEDGYVTDDEEEIQQKAMMPMADMLNADADFNARLFQDESCLKMRSTREIKQGEEVLNDFGTLPRSELLRRYGYVTDKYAVYDVIEIPLHLITEAVDQDDSQVSERLEKLEEDGLDLHGFIIDREDSSVLEGEDNERPPVRIPEELLDLLHALHADKAVWRKWRRKLDESQQEDLHRQVDKALNAVLTNRLSEYKTSAAEDRELLARGGLNRRQNMAVSVRLGEKQLLDEAISETNRTPENGVSTRLSIGFLF